MTMSASSALQSVLHATLAADEPLGRWVRGIFETPPRGTAFPYIVLGEDIVSDWSTKTFQGSEHRLTLHVWSQTSRIHEVKDLLALVAGALAGLPRDFDGYRLVNLLFLTSRVLPGADALTHHGLLELRVRLQFA